MYGSIRVDMLRSAADFHWLGNDSIAVLVLDDEEVIICLNV